MHTAGLLIAGDGKYDSGPDLRDYPKSSKGEINTSDKSSSMSRNGSRNKYDNIWNDMITASNCQMVGTKSFLVFELSKEKTVKLKTKTFLPFLSRARMGGNK